MQNVAPPATEDLCWVSNYFHVVTTSTLKGLTAGAIQHFCKTMNFFGYALSLALVIGTPGSAQEIAQTSASQCSDLGWTAPQPGHVAVCSQAAAPAGAEPCAQGLTLAEANDHCVSLGARLCAITSIQEDKMLDSECDYTWTWSNTGKVQCSQLSIAPRPRLLPNTYTVTARRPRHVIAMRCLLFEIRRATT